MGGYLDTVKLLMEHGASPALSNERNYVPLDLAHFNDKTEVAQYFLTLSSGLESSNQESGLDCAAGSLELADDESDKDTAAAVSAKSLTTRQVQGEGPGQTEDTLHVTWTVPSKTPMAN